MGNGGHTNQGDKAMLVHSVFFTMKGNLGENQSKAFREGLESLRAIESVEQMFIGIPAPTIKRPVIDQAYDYALTVLFRDMKAHDVYQDHPIHTAFVQKYSNLWEKVRVFDAV
jgi:hypothetical protein